MKNPSSLCKFEVELQICIELTIHRQPARMGKDVVEGLKSNRMCVGTSDYFICHCLFSVRRQ